MADEEIPVTDLKELLIYFPSTGKFFWKKRTPEMFNDGERCAEWVCRTWNSRNAGREAFIGTTRQGYKKGRINSRLYLAHRVAYAIYYGVWPNITDHINHIKDDNRIKNLRSVTASGNSKNRSFSKLNTSGSCGVSWHKGNKKWAANIRVRGKQKYLGHFTKKEDAIKAREAANKEYGYHENHGQVL